MDVGVLGNRESWYVADIARACRQRGHTPRSIDYRSLSASEGIHSLVPKLPLGNAISATLPLRESERRCGGSQAGAWEPGIWEPGAIDRGFPSRRLGTRGVSASEEASCELSSLDAVVVRTMPPGSLEQVVFRMDALARLEARGVTVLNPPKAIECAVDKYLATSKLAAEGLPVPETVVCQDAETALEAFEQLGGDVVVKPLFGAEGRGIVRVSDPDLAFRTFRTLERIQAVLYVQRFVQHEGYDVRVLVLDADVLGAFKRRSLSDFRTNVSRSANGERHQLTDEEVDLAKRAVRVTGTVFGGVDLLYDRSGRCFVLEVNAVPGWRAFQRVTGVDVALRVVAWLETAVLADRGL